jgi:hypothetical protein
VIQEFDMTTTAIDDEFGEEWLTADTKMSRGRAALIIAFAVSLVFLGGVQTQKWLGTDSSGSAASGLPAGFPSGGGPPAGFGGGSGTGSTTAGGSTGTGSSSSSSAPAVIGTVVAVTGDVWTIKDVGGTTHKVTVTGTTPIREESAIAGAEVKAGQSVTVEGTKDSGGAVTASKITVR